MPVGQAAEQGVPRSSGSLMRAALSFSRRADRLAELTGKVSMWVVVPLVVVGFLNVVLRYFGERIGTRLTTNGWIEAQWYLYSLIFLLGFNYILRHGINVRVDFWYGHQSARRKAWIDLIGHAIGLIPFCLIGIIISIPQVQTSWRLLETSPDPDGLPRYPIKTMIPIAFALLLIQGLAEVVKLIAVLREVVPEETVEEPEAPIRVE
jgi:TRAP-type mannitol/chloroaromatic compound transport system permease small subunit